jgi:hypothetical protein
MLAAPGASNSHQIRSPPGVASKRNILESGNPRAGDRAPSRDQKRAALVGVEQWGGHVGQQRAHYGRSGHGRPKPQRHGIGARWLEREVAIPVQEVGWFGNWSEGGESGEGTEFFGKGGTVEDCGRQEMEGGVTELGELVPQNGGVVFMDRALWMRFFSSGSCVLSMGAGQGIQGPYVIGFSENKIEMKKIRYECMCLLRKF